MKRILFILYLAYVGQLNADCTSFEIFEDDHALPMIKAELEGHHCAFTFDLGMQTGLSLSSELFKNIEPQKQRVSKQSLDLSGQARRYPTVVADVVHINGYPFKQVECSEHKSWGLWTGASPTSELSNTVGLGLFHEPGHLWYSLSSHHLTWCDEKEPIFHVEQYVWLPLKKNDEGVHVSLEADAMSFDFILDSAANVSLVKTQARVPVQPCALYEGYECAAFKDVRMGEEPINIHLIAHDLPQAFEADGILGQDFFEHHDIVIDNTNHRLGIRGV